MSLRRFLDNEGWLHFLCKRETEAAENKKELSKHIFSNDCVAESEISTWYLNLTQATHQVGVIIRKGI